MTEKCLALFIIVVVFQMGNAQNTVQDNSALLKASSILHRELSESTQADESALCDRSKCKGQSSVGFSFPDFDIPACIQATRDLADTEELLYEVYIFGKSVVSSAIDLVDNILACRNESSSVFAVLECVIVELEGSGSLWETVLNDFYDFIASLKTIALINDLKLCLGFNALTCLSC